jgi:hypothetical protein
MPVLSCFLFSKKDNAKRNLFKYECNTISRYCSGLGYSASSYINLYNLGLFLRLNLPFVKTKKTGLGQYCLFIELHFSMQCCMLPKWSE